MRAILFIVRSCSTLLALVVSGALTGCSIDDSSLGVADAGDAGGDLDGGGRDAAADAGRDGGPADAGRGDASERNDAGIDAGPVDGGRSDAGRVDAGTADAGCGSIAPTCVDDALRTCLGTGATVTVPCPLGCSPTVADRCARIAPSNVSADLFRDAATDVLLARDERVDTAGSCTVPSGAATVETLPDGSEVCVWSIGGLTVSSGVTVRVGGPRPLIVLAHGDVRIAGDIDVSAYGVEPGPGGGRGGDSGPNGTGRSPGAQGTRSGSYEEGGGGGGGLCGAGGDGGRGGSGGSHGVGGAGGASVAVGWTLEPLAGGSGGGRGGNTRTHGVGGAGGGGLQITADGTLSLSGRILSGGGGGGGGRTDSDCSVNFAPGAGGGSGGAVLLEAHRIETAGGASILTSGGGGGGGASGCAGSGMGSGGDGQDGVRLTGRANGGASGGSTWGAAGGRSGGGSNADGLDGADNTNTDANGGGGGGGAGCVYVRQRGGALPTGVTYSPSAAPGVRAGPLRLL